jgi:hypothetical protein
MIPYDTDPSLHASEPCAEVLDDGFSPPHHGEAEAPAAEPRHPVEREIAASLWLKSLF